MEAVECQRRALKILFEYEDVNKHPQKQSVPKQPTRWQPLATNCLKINLMQQYTLLKEQATE